MNSLFNSRRATGFATGYLVAVVICAALAFRPGDVFSFGWFVAVTCLTLPWSLLSWLFVWALIHDNTHYFAMSVHIGWGVLNSFIALWLAHQRRSGNARRDTVEIVLWIGQSTSAREGARDGTAV